DGSIAATAIFSRNRITLRAGETGSVDATFTTPPKTACRAVVALFRTTQPIITRNMQMTPAVGTLLTFRLSDALDLQSSDVAIRPQTQATNAHFAQTAINSGSEPAIARGVVAILDTHGALVGKSALPPHRLLPAERAELTSEFGGELAPGKYRVVVTLDLEGKIVTQQIAIVSPRNATTDTRYISTTKQIQSAIQITTPQTKVNAVIVRDAQKTSIPSASIQVGKTTILDHAVEDTPLTTSSAPLRGLHFFGDAWRIHAGITAPTFWDDFVLPSRRQLVLGGSRVWSPASHWRIMPSAYVIEHQGSIASLLAEYANGDRLRARGEIGYTWSAGALAGASSPRTPAGAPALHRFGAAVQIDANSDASRFRADLRWRPREFASVGPNDLHG